MREILFKAKRVDNSEWVEGYYFKATHHWHKHGMHEDWIAVDTIQNGGYCNVRGKYAIIPETLCQFTGLYDKNGKRIWENDIIFDTYYKKLGVVKFGMGTFDSGIYRYYGWHYESEGSVDHHELYKYDELVDFEVLGNIFDNPELLTAERIGDNEN